MAAERLAQTVAAERVLHEARARLGAVLVVAVLDERVHHRAYIGEQIGTVRAFLNEQALFGIRRAHTARNVDAEAAVLVCHKAHIAERGVYGVRRAATERYLELARHFDLSGDSKQIFRDSLSVGETVCEFSLLHAGQRTAHDVARVVTAAALCVDPDIDHLFHDDRQHSRGKIVELHCLTGGELDFVYLVFIDDSGQKFQLFLRHTPAGAAQAQHIFGGVALCIAAEAAAESFVVFSAEIPLRERLELFFKRPDFAAELLYKILIHHSDPLPFKF